MQPISTKRKQIEFYRFASLGEPQRAIAAYAAANERRYGVMLKHRGFIGAMSPFLEIGANAGHTSYMVANTFDAEGFALDLSADALRDGALLKDHWGMARSPVRIAGDAANLPFRDSSLRLVMAFQLLSQFPDIESLVIEVKRVLAPGGVFLFAEEPLRRMLSLELYRCPYPETMKAWERKLNDWGLLGFLVRDAIGAGQEDSFGIRQNYSLDLPRWREMLSKHFAELRLEVFVPERGWAERAVKMFAIRMDPYRSQWRAARLLGGTLAAICRKEGSSLPPAAPIEKFEEYLRCPACHGSMERGDGAALSCACGFEAPCEDGVYTLLPPSERTELYPSDRPDILDFAQPGHEAGLLEGFGQLEGILGNRYRWIGPSASARLVRVSAGAQQLRIRGHAPERVFTAGGTMNVSIGVNGQSAGQWKLGRPGLFVLEVVLPDVHEYVVEIHASPVWQAPPDDRLLSVNLSLIRLVPVEPD